MATTSQKERLEQFKKQQQLQQQQQQQHCPSPPPETDDNETRRPPLPSLKVALDYHRTEYHNPLRAATFATNFLQNKRKRDVGDDAGRPKPYFVDTVGKPHSSIGSVDEYARVKSLSEGVYGIVSCGRHVKTNKLYAIKQIKGDWLKDCTVGFPPYLMREFDLLMRMNHPNIVRGLELKTSENANKERSVFLVMEYCAKDLKGVIYSTPAFHVRTMNTHPDVLPRFASKAKLIVKQMLEGLVFLHDANIIHRDIKTSNVLVGDDGTVKHCDFGLSRFFREGLRLTPEVVTLVYRAPEIHLGVTDYGRALDVWSIGCIMAEMFLKEPLFAASNELTHFQRVCNVLGMPENDTFPGVMRLPKSGAMLTSLTAFNQENQLRSMFQASPRATAKALDDQGFDLLMNILKWNPKDRITAVEALKHPWLQDGVCSKEDLFSPMPTNQAVAAESGHQHNAMDATRLTGESTGNGQKAAEGGVTEPPSTMQTPKDGSVDAKKRLVAYAEVLEEAADVDQKVAE